MIGDNLLQVRHTMEDSRTARRLNLIGVIILLAGLAGASLIHFTVRDEPNGWGYDMTGGRTTR